MCVCVCVCVCVCINLNNLIFLTELFPTLDLLDSRTAYIYIYIYIVILRQIVSFYHKSSVGLDTQDVSSWDQNQADLRQSYILTLKYRHPQCKRRNFHEYIRIR